MRLTGDVAFIGMVSSFSDFPADFKRVKDFLLPAFSLGNPLMWSLAEVIQLGDSLGVLAQAKIPALP